MGTASRLVALVAVAFLASAVKAVPISDTLISVDGSGTSNFLPMLLKVFEMIRSRTKPFVSFSYRSLGTGPGKEEFLDSLDGFDVLQKQSFACGDVPLTTTEVEKTVSQSNPAINIPLLVSTVSIYANINGLRAGDLQLSPCTLAKIFQGDITTVGHVVPHIMWGDPAIKADNDESLHLTLDDAGNITVLYRSGASSSSYALTNYLTKATAGETTPCWTPSLANGTTFDLSFPSLVNTNRTGYAPVGNSQIMLSQLSSKSGVIGYVESGQGFTAGLNEVAVKNADGQYLTYKGADTKVVSPGVTLPTTLSESWSNVDLVFQPGTDYWPLTLVSYIFMRSNLTSMGDAGGITRYLPQFFLTDEAAAMMPDFGLFPFPQDKRISWYNELTDIIAVTGATWRNETAIPAKGVTTFRDDFVISSQRSTHVLRSLDTLSSDMKAVKDTNLLGGAYQLHGGGAFQAADYMRRLLATLQGQARAPIHSSYRVVGTIEAQQEFVNIKSSAANINNFKVGDIPLSGADYTDMKDNKGGMLHLPFAVGSMSVFFNQQLPGGRLRLDACAVAKMLKGSIASWSDPALNSGDLEGQNPFAKGPDASAPYINKTITVFGYSGASSVNQVLTNWLSKKCPTEWTDGAAAAALRSVVVQTSVLLVDGTKKDINIPDIMTDAIAKTPHSIGFLPTNFGAGAGLDEAELYSVTPGGQGSFNKATTTNLKNVVASIDSVGDFTAAGNWSSLDLTTSPNPQAQYPLTTLLFVYAYQNMSSFGSTGPLTKAMLQYMYSKPGQALLAESGLTPLPDALIPKYLTSIESILLKLQLASWTFETYDEVSAVLGQSLQSFSEARATSTQALIEDLQEQVTALRLQASRGVAVRVAVSAASAGGVEVYGSLLDGLSRMATYPVKFAVESVSGEAVAPLVQSLYSGNATVDVAFLDRALTTDEWTAAQAADADLLQVPVSVRPVALLYSAPDALSPRLRLSPCTLAKIINKDIKKWDAADLKKDNPGLTLPSNNILLTLPCTAAPCGPVTALLQYLAATCPDVAVTFKQISSLAADASNVLVTATTSDDVQVSEPFTVLSVGPPGWATANISTAGNGVVREAGVQGTSGAYLVASEVDTAALTAAFSTAVPAALAAAEPWDDWSAVKLSPAAAANKDDAQPYPILSLDYLIIQSDLRRLNDTAGAVKGMVAYLYGPASGFSGALGLSSPTAAPLPAAATDMYRQDLAALIRTGQGVASWPVVLSSQVESTADKPFVLSSYQPASLQGSSGLLGSVSDAKVASLAAAAARQQILTTAAPSVNTAKTQDVDKARSIAIAGLVLALVLALTALGVAIAALVQARDALATLRRELKHLPSSHRHHQADSDDASPFSKPVSGQGLGTELYSADADSHHGKGVSRPLNKTLSSCNPLNACLNPEPQHQEVLIDVAPKHLENNGK